jgi:hypothetical protein
MAFAGRLAVVTWLPGFHIVAAETFAAKRSANAPSAIGQFVRQVVRDEREGLARKPTSRTSAKKETLQPARSCDAAKGRPIVSHQFSAMAAIAIADMYSL